MDCGRGRLGNLRGCPDARNLVTAVSLGTPHPPMFRPRTSLFSSPTPVQPMANRTLALRLLPTLLLAACQPAADAGPPAEATPVVRGSDAAARGWTEADFPRVKELAPGVYSYEWLRTAETGGTTNCLFVVTTEGVLVADGLGSVEDTKRMVEEIAKITPQPIKWVVVGSDHGDHRGGDSAFPQDAKFYATTFSANVMKASAKAPDRAAEAPPVRVADVIVDDTLALTIGGKEVQIMNLGRAHTGGDLAVWLPAEKILFMSEIYFNHLFPSMRSSYPAEWIAAVERAQAMDVNIYVPGHGFMDSPPVLEEELEAYKQAMLAVMAETKRLHDAGVVADSVGAKANFGEYSSWAGRDRQTERNTPRLYMELDGKLDTPPGTKPIA
ncbi:MAG: MBL fold metallo-hydrolase [Gemmatimonadetes bacterium]|nr:MBL fold metallo-hydrolase [Gemmatimonadota bacterium]